MIFLYIFLVPVILSCSGHGYRINRTEEGYPVSFLSDCPGSMKPTEIADNFKHNIEIYVFGYYAPLGEGRTRKYTYNQVKGLAKDPTIDWNRKTILYVPGWFDNIKNLPIAYVMRKLYKQMGYNVLILEIINFMTQEWPIAARAMMGVGDQVGEMLARLKRHQPKFDPKKLEITGISLGGQTMGFIAKSYYNRTGVKISRLTGMDCAGPCFRNRGPEGRVDESDADFVDLILTNIDTYGMAAPVGHVNIYVNGGEYQPGDGYWMSCGPFCSHSRSVPLQMLSLLYPDSFIAIKCDSVQDARDGNCYDRKPMETITLGPKMDRNARGIYYLATSSQLPYYMGERGLKKENDFVLKKLTAMNKDLLTY
ncbi:lipase member H-A-like [Plodia interpunctella]|uniref:lipase member H-A-like n=1 Tax=Plodia interpunctella TaxID=58824 RepID=UPI002368C8E4|nr:lipase member H-A-like [Plodia interpunctella]